MLLTDQVYTRNSNFGYSVCKKNEFKAGRTSVFFNLSRQFSIDWRSSIQLISFFNLPHNHFLLSNLETQISGTYPIHHYYTLTIWTIQPLIYNSAVSQYGVPNFLQEKRKTQAEDISSFFKLMHNFSCSVPSEILQKSVHPDSYKCVILP